MKKSKLFAVVFAAVLVGCSNDGMVNESTDKITKEIPIEFSVQKQNITRATSTLQSLNHYNFGVWAYKTVSSASQLVMDNYLVGFGDETNKKGYDHTGATTWAATTSSTSDHTSPWFYEKLGNAEYSRTSNGSGENYYLKSQTAYMSKNAYQYLRYWDYNSTKTEFYCYAPYDADGVTFDEANKKMTFVGNKAIRDGYDNPVNSDYTSFDRSLSELMVAGASQASTSYPNDVNISFKHLGAQLEIRFYENIPGYRVRIIELNGNNGTMKTGTSNGITITDDMKKGIQATPAVKPSTGTTYTVGEYYTQIGGEVSFANITSPTFTPSVETSTKVKTPLMFKIPDNSTGNLTSKTINTTPDKSTATNTTFNNLIWGEGEKNGTNQKYSYSPTIYYPVAQPTTSTTGFTFHVSYEIIAEDNGEVTTVHNATVFVPANDGASTPVYVAAWQQNTKYTYTFKITKNSSGTTNPGTTIDPTDPTPSTTNSLYPIVFDNVTIEDYTTPVGKEYNIN